MNRKNLVILFAIVVAVIAMDWILQILLSCRILPPWFYFLTNFPFGFIYTWTEAHWVPTHYEIGGRLISDTVIIMAQLSAVAAQVLLYYGLWRIWEHKYHHQPLDC
jgi:hypothetical protein